ncbi:outer membrane protein assembly factor BamB [Ramlibacter sp. 2FC]|uniref:outer membrane protein assembly factor BamB n=1 Tax=Ramlibacter sp. 2FC TaxID=2502188 RepID=UPI00201E596C|nr:outer membrane protein assembly factor BamB [Ramlibacter sp. 2FC]
MGLALALVGCSSTRQAPKPAELAPISALQGVRLAWQARLPAVAFPLEVSVQGQQLVVAGSDGTVLGLDAVSGRELWRAALAEPLAAGVGSDGRLAAVVTRSNEVLVLEGGRTLWRQKLPAQSYTAPLVAGGRVFVLAADRSVTGFDARTGRKLWTQQRPGEALVLQQAGVLLPVGDTLVAGLSGRLVGLDPLRGSVRWEAALAAPRGTNDVERLVDLVGRVSRQGEVVCARAFQAAVGCVDAVRGNLLWSKPANGAQGLHGDERFVFGSESDGKLVAWRRADGERAWTSDQLQFRSLTAPLALGRSVVVGDSQGLVHLLSREDGSPLNRLATDGSGVAAAPALAGGTLVVVTRAGGIFGFRPE